MILLLLTLAVPVAGLADSEVNLNGFQLWQFKSVVHDALGKPFKTIKTGTVMNEAHRVGEDAYMVFRYMKEYPNRIAMIQMTGTQSKMVPFKGLMLGDDARKIKRALGSPLKIKNIKQPKVQQWIYKEVNYSLEVDEAGKLYSIQINVNPSIMNDVGENDSHWEDFKKAVREKNVTGILDSLRPDVEIYRNGLYQTIQKPMTKFRSAPDPHFMSAFWDGTDNILAELEATEPDHEARITTKMGMGMVYKFYKGKILKEIVFFPYNGKYRIYEITFRQ